MEIISHRGYWESIEQQNSIEAFYRSFVNGFGVETDIRDYKGKLVVSHNIASDRAIPLELLFKTYNETGNKLPLALNIKSDGLQDDLEVLLSQYEISNYFLFDMSIPDLMLYRKKSYNIFLRLSEFESDFSLIQFCKGIWLDAFNHTWYSKEMILEFFSYEVKLCIVSDELHGRDYQNQWNFLRRHDFHKSTNLILCTDFPLEARNFFQNEK